VEDYINTIRERIYYSGYIVDDKWRPSGEYMETDIYIYNLSYIHLQRFRAKYIYR
jgi:hypothetical protein